MLVHARYRGMLIDEVDRCPADNRGYTGSRELWILLIM